MKSYLASIRQFLWIAIACTLVASGVGVFISLEVIPPTYQATSMVLVQRGAPGTTYPGGPANATPSDNLGLALTYSAEIPTRVVMEYILHFDPELQKRHYTADDLILDVAPSPGTTSATISILATAPTTGDALLIANDVAKGFSAYVQSQTQRNLDLQRKNLQSQINSDEQQKAILETKLASLPNNNVPQYPIYSNDLASVTHNIDSLQAQLQLLPSTVNSEVALVQLADGSDVTPSPKGLIIMAVSAGVGLLVGVLIMLLTIFLDNRLHSDEEVKEKLGLAYLGSLSDNNEIKATPTSPTGTAVHELADIRTNLRLTGVLPGQWQAPQGAVLLITSPQVADGKTTLAAALSTTVARGGSTVVVIDGNLRQPSTHLAFGMRSAGIGLTGLLKGAGSIDDAVVRSNTPGVWLLAAGNPMEDAMLSIEQKLPGILRHLRSKTDLVIIDGPALLSGADASVLATMADGVALVVDAKHEKLPLLLRSRELLQSLTHKPAGVVMNHLVRKRNNVYYATPYPALPAYSVNGASDASERWVALPAHADGGNRQKLEPMSAMLMVKGPSSASVPPAPPSPVPSGLLSTSATREISSDRPSEPSMMPQNNVMASQNVLSSRLASRRVDINPPPPIYPGKSE